MCCLKPTVSLGCFNLCDDAIVPIETATTGGEFEIKIQFLSGERGKLFTYAAGDVVNVRDFFPSLAADYEYAAELIRPDGTKLVFCFTIKLPIL